MSKILVYSTLLLVSSAAISVAGYEIIPSGKCPNLKRKVDLDLDKIGSYGRWNIIYVTGIPEFLDVDNAYHVLVPVSSHVYDVLTVRVLKDNSTSVYKDTFGYENRTISENMEEKEGGKFNLYHTPLAITSSKAVLYIRCSDRAVGDINVDVRFLSIPIGRVMSESDETFLLEADRDFNFKGNLIKLPRKYV